MTANAVIVVDGADGSNDSQHGGGGGAGGGILLHGDGGLCEGVLTARGGRGGDDGSGYVQGGGGGGGRIAMLDLQSECLTDVSGGERGGSASGAPGEVLFRAWEPPDLDGDGYVDEVAGGDDCDDGDPSVHPGAPDAPGDGIDSDCDGVDPSTTGTGPTGTTGGTPTGTDTTPGGTDVVPGGEDPFAGEGVIVASNCGCAGAPGPWAGVWALGLLGALVRRRR
ncbi:MAG: putative metal-binding motif-containing protein [Myxococcota bacterium]